MLDYSQNTDQKAESCLDRIVRNQLLADTHCHLTEEYYKGKYTQLFQRAKKRGLKEIWLMSVNFHSALANIEIIDKYQKLFPDLKLRFGLGFDMELVVPGSDLFNMQWFSLSESEISARVKKMLAEIVEIASEKNIEPSLVGEIGLDHYHLERNYQTSLNDPDLAVEKGIVISTSDIKHSKQLQLSLLKTQLDYAVKHKLPVSLHSRGAETECVEIIKGYQNAGHKLSGVFHSFTGNPAELREIFRLGFFVGVNGIVTYKSARHILQAVKRRLRLVDPNLEDNEPLAEKPISQFKRLPIQQKLSILYKNQIVLETDAPFLIPANASRAELKRVYEQEISEPANIVDTLEYIFQ